MELNRNSLYFVLSNIKASNYQMRLMRKKAAEALAKARAARNKKEVLKFKTEYQTYRQKSVDASQRYRLLAYGIMKNRSYKSIEPHCRRLPQVEILLKYVFINNASRDTVRRFLEMWMKIGNIPFPVLMNHHQFLDLEGISKKKHQIQTSIKSLEKKIKSHQKNLEQDKKIWKLPRKSWNNLKKISRSCFGN